MLAAKPCLVGRREGLAGQAAAATPGFGFEHAAGLALAESTAIIPFRYMTLLAQPIVHTLRPFLEAGGDEPAVVDAMHDAWRKSVLLQVTLWSHPYIKDGDY